VRFRAPLHRINEQLPGPEIKVNMEAREPLEYDSNDSDRPVWRKSKALVGSCLKKNLRHLISECGCKTGRISFVWFGWTCFSNALTSLNG
jgi:hypothetical protein